MALPGESYKLALTPGLLDVFQSKASPLQLATILTGPTAQYRDLDGDGRLWIPSGQVFYSPNPGDPAPLELTFAQAHFFLPHRFQDPFGNNTLVEYDAKYNLLPISTRDAAGNETSADYDYRLLQPRMVTDPNDNRMEACFDALGMLAGTALRGKAAGPVEGDSFDDFSTDPTPAEIKSFFDAADPRTLAIAHLGTATTRILYDLERIPACAASIARETHVSALAPGIPTKVQLHFVYSDGFGRAARARLGFWSAPRALAFFPESQTHVSDGKEYVVYAMSVFKGVPFLQIVDDLNVIVWLPTWLFDVRDPTLPEDWFCNLFTGDVAMAIGPDFIAASESSYTRMVELEPASVELFWHRFDALYTRTTEGKFSF